MFIYCLFDYIDGIYLQTFCDGVGENKKMCIDATLLTWSVCCRHVTGSLIYWLAVTLKPYIYTSRNCESCEILGFLVVLLGI